jgi:hypothetical protein
MQVRVLDNIKRGHMLFVLLMMAQFQIWDGIITQVFVNNRVATEANNIVAPMVHGGSFLSVKLAGVAVLLLLLWFIYKRFPRVALTAASFVTLFYAGVIIWNFTVVLSGIA